MSGTTVADSETRLLLHGSAAPKDYFNLAYITYFILGAGYLFPWHAFITGVDYFSYIYPGTRVDRIFAGVYVLVALIFLVFLLFYTNKSSARVRINVGLVIFVIAMIMVPVLDLFYIKGQVGLYNGFYVTVFAVALCGVADGLVQGGLIGFAGELPERYMQAVVSGPAGSAESSSKGRDQNRDYSKTDGLNLKGVFCFSLKSIGLNAGVFVSFLRIICKAAYPQDAHGLRKSANLYFAVGIVCMLLSIILYNVAEKFPVIKHYKNVKNQEKEKIGPLFGAVGKSTLWKLTKSIRIYGVGLLLVYLVTMTIFPGYVTEDVHSVILKDWYPIFLITCYNVFDLIGKCSSAFYLMENPKLIFGSTVARFLFYPLFLACLHGPQFLRTEIPVTILTCLLGLTNGYFTVVTMIWAPKVVGLEYAEITGVILILFLFVGMVVGSIVTWFWVI